MPEQVAVGPRVGWIVGWRGGPGISERIGAIVRVAGGRVETDWEGPGWVRCLDDRRGVFAVHVTPGPRFTLLRRGLAWEDLGEIPGVSVTQVLAVSPGEAWLLGADTLVRWEGRFHAVAAPGERDGTRERLFLCGNQVVLAGQDALWIARDGGARWSRRHTDGAHVRALEFPYVVAPVEGRLRIGRLEPTYLAWIGEVHGPGDPVAFGHSGGAMQLLLVPTDPARTPGLVRVYSRRGGGFRADLLSVAPSPAWAGLHGARRILAVAPDRTILGALE